MSYAVDDDEGIKRMMLCMVLCGESIVGNHKYIATNWPTKQNGDLFDSLKSQKEDIYVIKKDNRMYPMYLITFKQ